MTFNIIELFSGIGAQHKALKNLNIDYDVLAICEWNIDALISYTAIHETTTIKNNNYENVKITISKDGNKPYDGIKLNDIENKAIQDSVKYHNNIGSILDFSKNYNIVKDVHLLTYSFPCQNLSTGSSIHGYNTGIKRGANDRSALLWEMENVLDHLNKLKSLPKYLILENVKALLSKRNKSELDEWLKLLSDKYGYKHCEPVILNSKNFGVAQHRERVFIVSYLNNKPDIDSLTEVNEEFDINPIISETNNKHMNEALDARMRNTPSRVKMAKLGKDVCSQKYCQTITKKQDRWPHAGCVELVNEDDKYLNKRFITPRECWKLMGFSNEDFDKASKRFTWKKKETPLYAQAGNSIVVNVMEKIIERIEEVCDYDK